MLVKHLRKVLSTCWLLFKEKKGENMGVAAKVTFLSARLLQTAQVLEGEFPSLVNE